MGLCLFQTYSNDTIDPDNTSTLIQEDGGTFKDSGIIVKRLRNERNGKRNTGKQYVKVI